MNRALRALRWGLRLGLLFAVASASALEPDALRFRRYDVDAGLSNNTARAFAQDGDGYLWIGTRDGLNRFDGQAFRVYRLDRNDPYSLPDNDVRSLATSPEGELWIGTASGGLARYDASLDRFERFVSGPATGLASNTIRALHFDPRGELWVTCTPFGVQRFDRRAGRAQNAPFGIPTHLVSTLTYIDLPDGGLVLVSGNNLWRWERGSSQVQALVPDAATVLPTVFELALRDRHGDYWVGFLSGGLVRLSSDGRPLARYRTGAEDGLQSEVSAMLETDDGRLWIATSGGIALHDREQDRFVERLHDRSDPTSPPEQPNVLFEDRAGLIWLGSWQGGIAVHDPQGESVRQYRPRQSRDGLPGNLVRSVLPERDGSLWLALSEVGLVRFLPGRGVLEHFRHRDDDPSSLASDQPAALARASDGTLWIGFDSTGLDRMAPNARRFDHYRRDPNDPTSLPYDLINTLYVDAEDTLWVGSDGGGAASLCRGCTQFRRYGADPDNAALNVVPTINAIVPMSDGAFWLGSYGRGLARLDPDSGRLERYASAADGVGPSNDVVRTLYVDRHERLWVGTASGLDRVERDASGRVRFVHHRGPAWAGKDNITCIREDARGMFWLGTASGLYRFDPDTGAIAHTSVLGRLDRGGYYPNACREHDGRLYFGGASGLTVFAPDELPPVQPVGPLVLDQLFLFNAPVRPQPSGENAVLQRSLSRTAQLRLNHTQDVFGFSFAALDFRNPQDVRYQYRLEGLNEAWLPVSTAQRYVGFAGLPAGNYVFRVEANRGDSRSEASVALRVLPPPWRSAWAHTLYVVAALAAIALIIWRVRARIVYEREAADTLRRSQEALRRLNDELEHRVAERTTDLSASNSELTETLGRLREAQEQLVEAEKLASLGSLVAGVAHEINTPLGVGVTGASFLAGEAQRVKQRLDAGVLTSTELAAFAKTAGETAELLLRNLQQAGRLVQSFKRVAVAEASEEQRTVELGACLQDILAMLGPNLKQTSHRIVLEQAEPITLKTAPGALYQIVTNLVTNALMHAFEPGQSGTITLRAVRDADAVRLEIADNGRGMSDHVRAHVFEPFFTTKRGQGGTGLGLHIVYTLVSQVLKGRIRCDSAAGRGTRFEIRLPLA